MSNVTVKGLLEALHANPGALVRDIVSHSDIAAMAKERRDMELVMRRAASRIKRLEQELDMLHGMLQQAEGREEIVITNDNEYEPAVGDLCDADVPEDKGSNVVPIAKHPKFPKSSP